MLYSPAAYGVDLTTANLPKPRGRINAGVVVLKNTLWLFGGIVEIFDKEITLDDIWCFDLNKYDGWKCIRDNSVGEEVFKDVVQEESSQSESETESDSDSA